MLSLFFLGLFLCAAPWPAAAQDDDGAARHAAVRLVPERNVIRPGETLTVGIEQVMDEGWHTYWINPGDSGEPMRLSWHLPPGFAAGPTSWPVPEKIVTGPLVSYGYEGRAVLLMDVTAPDPLPPGPLVLKAEMELLVCADICIPEFGTYELFLNAEPPQDNGAFIAAAQDRLPRAIPGAVTFREEAAAGGGMDFVIAYQGALALPPGAALTLIPQDWGVIDNVASSAAVADEGGLDVRHRRGDRPLRALERVRGLLTFEDESGILRGYAFNAVPEAAAGAAGGRAAGGEAAAGNVAAGNAAAGVSVARALLFALLGGLVLNLMPCVFPILSLKALKLCKMSGRELGYARRQSLFYMAGILASFGAFAALLLALRAAGQQVGWGFQLQNPAFVVGLAWLLFMVGLNLSGYFELGGRLANVGHKLADGHDYAASFFTGVLAALVATPCTAPFMGVAVGFALTQPPAVILAVFAALGMGLALPYLVLAFLPALHRILPRPGAWMETFRQFLAFPMFASAAWLVWVYSQQGGALSVLVALAGATALAFAVWLFAKAGRHRGAVRAVLVALAVLFLLAPAFMLAWAARGGPEAGHPATSVSMPEGWIPYDPADFARREAGDAPIFVDMTAAWCITCKVNERVVLETEAVRGLFARHGVQAVKGDWTNYNDDITSYLAAFGRSGVPLYVYYGPRGAESGVRPDPVVLPQILTPGIVAGAIEGRP